MAKSQKPPHKILLDVDENGDLVPGMLVEADGTKRPPTPEELAENEAASPEISPWVQKAMEAGKEIRDGILKDPSYRPPLTGRYIEYLMWKTGKSPNYRPTFTDIQLLAWEDQRSTYGVMPQQETGNTDPPGEAPTENLTDVEAELVEAIREIGIGGKRTRKAILDYLARNGHVASEGYAGNVLRNLVLRGVLDKDKNGYRPKTW